MKLGESSKARCPGQGWGWAERPCEESRGTLGAHWTFQPSTIPDSSHPPLTALSLSGSTGLSRSFCERSLGVPKSKAACPVSLKASPPWTGWGRGGWGDPGAEGVEPGPRQQADLLACLFKSQVIWEEEGVSARPCYSQVELLPRSPAGVPALPSVTHLESLCLASAPQGDSFGAQEA